MPLTRSFKETVRARVERDADFRAALLTDAVGCLIEGEVDVGKAILRDFINATIGFEALATQTGKPAKSLMRMLGPSGNPTASNLFAILGYLQASSGIRLEVSRAS